MYAQCLFLVFFIPVSTEIRPSEKETLDLPHLDRFYGQNITAQEGGVAELECRVFNLGSRSLSWIRRRDARILTVDKEIFITDERISVARHQDVWVMKITGVRSADAGLYECQISTNPKSFKVLQVRVKRPQVMIEGGPDLFVRDGSSITMQCIVSNATVPIHISWEFNGQMILGTTYRNQTTVISQLRIEEADKRKAGIYSCLPSMYSSVAVKLHVLGKPGELQLPITNSAFRHRTMRNITRLLFLLIIYIT